MDDMLINFLESKNIKRTDILSDNDTIKSSKKLTNRDYAFFQIEELTFEDDSPRKEALENVISSLDIDGINFVYLLIGDGTKVSFYFGISKDKISNEELELDIDDIGTMILQSSIEGNFRGSKTKRLKESDKKNLLETINSFNRIARVDGVPNVNNEKEEFQGVDRLVDVMMGDEFALMIIADPLTKEEIENIEDSLYEIYNKLSLISKISIQETKGNSETTGWNYGTNSSKSYNSNNSITKNFTEGTSLGVSASEGYNSSDGESNSKSTNDGINSSYSQGTSMGSGNSTTKGESKGVNGSRTINNGNSESYEKTDKNYNEWIKYIDEILLPRLGYGKGKGLFQSCTYLFAKESGELLKLGNTIKSLYSGTENNKSPLTIKRIKNQEEITKVKEFQFPTFLNPYYGNKSQLRLLFSKSYKKLGNWLSINELSVMTSLPQKEIVGLTLKEEIEFGLNIKKTNTKNEDKLLLGNLVKSGNILKNVDIFIDKKDLNKHIFIAGVTGSGKTTTCQRILISTNYPFLVIEPAKTEYRILTKNRDDITIFTLGSDNIAPFRINPFEFFKGENISSRVDMIKANIEAAFDMEAAIPQIIETALYECYENYGWDISTSQNIRFEDPFADGIYSFPTLDDLIKQVKKVVENQGFDDRLKNDYLGSIRARLQGLIVGSKGLMLNTPRSIDFSKIIKKNVIFELEEIKNGAEKSLVMGFVLINLNEALKQKHKKDKDFRHITLIEEAHRLLAKYIPGENPSKKLGVETFTDMLAEVRKYGESLIIVDQIPNKLTPEVLKNTNTKIIHRLFASDDKDAVGNTMALDNEQKQFLSSLEIGRVIVSNQDFTKPIQVQIKQLEDISTTGEDEIDESVLRKICLKYYQENYKRGIIQGLELFETEPSLEDIEKYLKLNFKSFFEKWEILFKVGKKDDKFPFNLKEFLCENRLDKNIDEVVIYLMNKFYGLRKDDFDKIKNYLESFLKDVLENGRNEYILNDRRYLTIR